MATAYVSMGQAGAMSKAGTIPVFRGPGRTETISTSGTSAAGSLVAQKGEVAKIFCATAIIANVSAAASASAGYYVPAGVEVYIAVSAGDVIHAIDA